MSIAIELTKLINTLRLSFIERSVARELESMLMQQAPVGEIQLNVPAWAEEWAIDGESIWKTIQSLEGAGFWHTDSGMDGETLVCKAIKDSAKAIGRSKKKESLAGIKSKAIEQRASSMTLADADVARTSAMAEVVEQIPYDTRFIRLREPYAGWLPSDRYSASGMTFKPGADVVAKLAEQFAGIDIELALALMYEDLRECPQERPSIAAFRYWMPNWVNKNAERLKIAASNNAINRNIDSMLDDY